MSSIRCGSNFFGLAFLSSSAFNRLTSDTMIPEYFAFKAPNVPSDILCSQHRSARFTPSTYTSTVLLQDPDDLLIASYRSLHRPSLPWGGLQSWMEKNSVAGQ